MSSYSSVSNNQFCTIIFSKNQSRMSVSSHFGIFIFCCFWLLKISCNGMFIFLFVLPILPCKQKTLYRKSRNLSDKKTKNQVTKICDEPSNSLLKPNYFVIIFSNTYFKLIIVVQTVMKYSTG